MNLVNKNLTTSSTLSKEEHKRRRKKKKKKKKKVESVEKLSIGEYEEREVKLIESKLHFLSYTSTHLKQHCSTKEARRSAPPIAWRTWYLRHSNRHAPRNT
jgi:hypothetical protein